MSNLIWSVLMFGCITKTVWELFNHTFDFTPFNIFVELVMFPLGFIYQLFLLKKEVEKARN